MLYLPPNFADRVFEHFYLTGLTLALALLIALPLQLLGLRGQATDFGDEGFQAGRRGGGGRRRGGVCGHERVPP